MSGQIVRDLSHCILRDGSIFCALGDQFASDNLYGDIAFVPARDGAYFATDGRRYNKPYFQSEHGRTQTSPRATVTTIDGVTIELPGVHVDPAEIIDLSTPEEMRRTALRGPHGETILNLESFLASRLEGRLRDALSGQFGLIGSVGIGLEREGLRPHDFDIVVSTNRDTRTALLASLQDRVRSEVEARVFEYGKSWQVRQRVRDEVLCLFFRESEVRPVEIRGWTSEVVEIVGVVEDVSDSTLSHGRLVVRSAHGMCTVVIVGLRHRGDFRVGQDISVRGRWCDASSAEEVTHRVLVVIEEEPLSLHFSAAWGEDFV